MSLSSYYLFILMEDSESNASYSSSFCEENGALQDEFFELLLLNELIDTGLLDNSESEYEWNDSDIENVDTDDKILEFLSRLDGKILDEIDPIQETFKYRKTEVIIDDKKTIDKKLLDTRKIKIRSDSNFIRKIKLISESSIIRKIKFRSDSNFIRNRKFISDSEIEKIADYVGSENFTKILSKDFRKRRKFKKFLIGTWPWNKGL
ncbi:unnamed protein product [Blepharisma stoltei]|uniref:Protein TIC 214 n=1 Tax=Blepharisma stoltei TaxID=1481888 RepID=A0AAU9J440_9CILI|nr:unnamed protein product [Blepharisma stoltei]